MSEDAFKKTAHDLNNLLTGIVNGIELLKTNLDNRTEAEKALSNLSKTTNRAMDIVQAVLNRKSDGKTIDFVDIDMITSEVVAGFTNEEQERIKIDSQSDLPQFIADSTDVFRIVQNLCKNALEATLNKGKVEIALSKINVNDLPGISIKIIDTGSGIDQENIESIFEPKFSTKAKSVDSGYGLSIVKEKVENLNGNISVSSNKGKTIFSIAIPVEHVVDSSKINILLAEDDESVSEVLADLLSSQGYSVALAVTGNATVEMALNRNYNLMIIDKQLPELDGLECIKQIRANNNKTPVVLASGSDVSLNDNEMRSLNIQKVICKPYKFPEILSAIRRYSV